MEYVVLAYYLFTSVEDAEREIKEHKKFFKSRDIRCRIYISHEGINGQMSASKQAAHEYMEWLKNKPAFASIEFKLQEAPEHVFAKATVKMREQLVALDAKVKLELGGGHISAEKWAEMLETRDDHTLVLDVRNDYESAVGHFEGAFCPQLETFREFPKLADELKSDYDPETTTVMMYCTGGIRCEVYSAMMREKGYKNVVQLDGGVIRYGEKMGSKHWKGKLFVFDDRLAVPLSPTDSGETISTCSFCGVKNDTYLNCAHMDCNKLFLACPKCAKEHNGCCSTECMGAKRVRKFDADERPKPYRKLPFEEKQCF
ncbi:MAG: rhodanese-related sulfurtransferase [Chlamydiia bacterium]|nr:rhodanese-related sulfurtransferase [Chlamydiia bacterium]MCP5509185.1 rhodanese-related sulfurtransferase [Chlamydiales bacterium]